MGTVEEPNAISVPMNTLSHSLVGTDSGTHTSVLLNTVSHSLAGTDSRIHLNWNFPFVYAVLVEIRLF